MLECAYVLLNEIKFSFFSEMNNRSSWEFDGEELRCVFLLLLFTVNLTQHVTNLNVKLRGTGKHVGDLFACVKSF
jgi:hypothetical protein